MDNQPDPVNTRTGLSVEAIKAAILDHLNFSLGTLKDLASPEKYCAAVCLTVRDHLLYNSLNSVPRLVQAGRTVVYLSAEYLMGPQLHNNLLALGAYRQFEQALDELGVDLKELIGIEVEPGLGSGGLGRLAACYLDSLATLEVPAIGYGIYYEFGIFDQQIIDGWQVEKTDLWLNRSAHWEVVKEEFKPEVGFEGHTVKHRDCSDRIHSEWIPGYSVRGKPLSWQVAGFNNKMATSLRLWKAEACESFDFQDFNQGDYYGAVEQKVLSENLTKVLYPNDEALQGKALRLKQQYFLVSCALQELIRFLDYHGADITRFHEEFCIQLNDTHPALAIPELMRLLVDVHKLDWNKAWHITRSTFSYTNHTLLPEALECWPVHMLEMRLPRHLEIIYEINTQFLAQVRRQYPNDDQRVARMSLIDEHGEQSVRMANLACVGSHTVNGVSALHSALLKDDLLRDFFEFTPKKFTNVTNGVTPRRFLHVCNPGLSELITHQIGDRWITNLFDLRQLEEFADDEDFQQRWRGVKQVNKSLLTHDVYDKLGIRVDPQSMFDIQCKRIHEYKRQLLNILNIISLYNRIQQNPGIEIVPRTFIFGGKAAPGYHLAKLTIKLITSVAAVINRDKDVADRLKVIFYPNFNVKNGQLIYPAADLSEQISTAGKEASGTGNMKFSLNGALTVGTLDGANIEIREEVGEDNFFLFGLTADEISSLRAKPYLPWDFYQADPELEDAINLIKRGVFSPKQPDLFQPLVGSVLHHDEYMVLADYRSYIDCQDRVSKIYQDPGHWTRMSILNVARMGKFSSDRAIQEYCDNIWNVATRNKPAQGVSGSR
jgi:starch phosphorylase